MFHENVASCKRVNPPYGALKRNLAPITHKMLSTQLKELEKDGMIIRKEYPRVPPKVEYSLSDKGKTFVPIINAMCDWGKAYPINSSFGTH